MILDMKGFTMLFMDELLDIGTRENLSLEDCKKREIIESAIKKIELFPEESETIASIVKREFSIESRDETPLEFLNRVLEELK